MSTYLWRAYFNNDVDQFRHILAQAAYYASSQNAKPGRLGSTGLSSSPGPHMATSPTMTHKSRKSSGPTATGSAPRQTTSKSLANVTLSRADLNWADSKGVTLLHQIASCTVDNASDFALALLEQPLLDLYMQDEESGWTALHRALYFGNITIARALMNRDIHDATELPASGAVHTSGSLIKIKDREGNSPFDVYAASIANRIIRQPSAIALLGSQQDDGEEISQDIGGDDDGLNDLSQNVIPRIQINGDEMFVFGSNKNFTLGCGDEDDRQFPERVSLKRPDHLMRRFLREHVASGCAPRDSIAPMSLTNVKAMPALVQYRPMIIQDVQLSKLHSAVLSTDPEANLYTCGFGSGGRLGTGDETTRFSFVNIHGGALMGKRIVAIGLGQDHSIAISSEGETVTWGSNAYGQLGYNPNASSSISKEDKPVQLLPRQVFGPLKREVAVGAAASRIHSVVFTAVSLYTFGKNDGQLGLVDSDARSRMTQDTPRKVAASLFSSAIDSVSAIDKATICLLENHEVWVFANYGYTRMSFPLDGFSNYFLQTITGSMTQRMPMGAIRGNEISRITAGGDTICAMSSMGDVFTVQVSQKSDSSLSSSSTTNPAKIRGALSPPQRVWSLKKGHMAVRDVDVGQDGSVIICTESGSVWRRVKRAKIKDATTAGQSEHKAKDYKFSRVPRLTGIISVRSNAFGGFAALRRDCDVLKTQVDVEPSRLWKDLYPLMAFHGFGEEDSDTEQPAPRFWTSSQSNDIATIRNAVLNSRNIENEMASIFSNQSSSQKSTYDVSLGTTTSDVRIPIHEFIIVGRSEVMRHAFSVFRNEYFFSIPEVLTIEYGKEGQALVLFEGIDLIAVLNLVLYMYTDSTIDVWHHTKRAPQSAFAYRQVRAELIKVSAQLEMRKLEHAVRVMSEPPKTLHDDLQQAIEDPSFFDSSDVEIELDQGSVKVHSSLMCQRCPFFEGLFAGRAAGRWLASRLEQRHESHEAIKIDLKHVNPTVFGFVLRHLYADTDQHMFDDIVRTELDLFLDLVLQVLAVADELMLDRLSQCCQKTLGRYVNTRNVCQWLNAIAPCSVTEFKDAALEYICLNLEGMLENHLLGELDDELILELDGIVRQNQLNCLPVSKSGRAEAELFENHPELAERLEHSKSVKIDAAFLHSRLNERESRQGSAAKTKVDLLENFAPTPYAQKEQRHRTPKDSGGSPGNPLFAQNSPVLAAAKSPVLSSSKSPVLSGKESMGDLMFDMDDHEEGEGAFQTPKRRHRRTTDSPSLPPLGFGLDDDAFPPIGLSHSPGAAASLATSAKSPPLSKGTSGFRGHQGQSTPGNSKSWASSPFSGSRFEMKAVMPQIESSRISSITSGLSLANQSSDAPTGSLPSKMSQKERKRQQQQRHSQIPVEPAASSPAVGNTSSSQPTSPWQVAFRGPKVNLKDVLDVADSRPAASKAVVARTPSPMTLRQTVSGKLTPSQRSISGDTGATPTESSQQRPPSSKTASPPPRSLSAAMTIKTAADFPDLHSARPKSGPPAVEPEPTLQLSMADILAQQNREKELFKEVATSKRSLQEIQTEQAFQEWWDVESRKAREAEAGGEGEEESALAAAAVGNRGGKGGRGRGRGRSRSGRGGGGKGVEAKERGKGKGRESEGAGEGSKSTPKKGPRAPYMEGEKEVGVKI